MHLRGRVAAPFLAPPPRLEGDFRGFEGADCAVDDAVALVHGKFARE
jgi:hypothetical protein